MGRVLVVGVGLLLTCMSAAHAKQVDGFDCWTLGMSPEAVKACSQHGPYTDVKVTGGLETANGDFEETKTNVSFLFESGHLVKIQVWLCEQTDLDTAVSSATRAWRYLLREFGQVRVAGAPFPVEATAEEFTLRARALAAALPTDRQDRFHLIPVSKIEGASVWGSVFRNPQYGYYVFLFFAKP